MFFCSAILGTLLGLRCCATFFNMCLCNDVVYSLPFAAVHWGNIKLIRSGTGVSGDLDTPASEFLSLICIIVSC